MSHPEKISFICNQLFALLLILLKNLKLKKVKKILTKKLSASWRMKNTKKKLNGQSKVVKYSFTGSNITKYSGLNTVAKYMNKQVVIF